MVSDIYENNLGMRYKFVLVICIKKSITKNGRLTYKTKLIFKYFKISYHKKGVRQFIQVHAWMN